MTALPKIASIACAAARWLKATFTLGRPGTCNCCGKRVGFNDYECADCFFARAI